MRLTPKNWSRFQHYKTRRPPWIKYHRDLLDNYEFHCLPDASAALAGKLWLLASEYEGGNITANLDEIAFRFRRPKIDIASALIPLIDTKFFDADSEMLAVCKQNLTTETETEEEVSSSETVSRPLFQSQTCVDDENLSDEKKPRASRADMEVLFQRFKIAMPKRNRTHPWSAARVKFERLVKSGVDPEAIIAGAMTYGDEIRQTQRTGTEFVLQATTFLNQKRFADRTEQEGAEVALFKPFEVFPETDEWRAWWSFFGEGKKTFAKSQMIAAKDFGKPYLAPTRWPIGREPEKAPEPPAVDLLEEGGKSAFG